MSLTRNHILAIIFILILVSRSEAVYLNRYAPQKKPTNRLLSFARQSRFRTKISWWTKKPINSSGSSSDQKSRKRKPKNRKSSNSSSYSSSDSDWRFG